MTNEQAIAILKDINSRYPCSLESTFEEECEQIALNMAIQALNTQESLEKKIEFLMNGRLGEWAESGGDGKIHIICPYWKMKGGAE